MKVWGRRAQLAVWGTCIACTGQSPGADGGGSESGVGVDTLGIEAGGDNGPKRDSVSGSASASATDSGNTGGATNTGTGGGASTTSSTVSDSVADEDSDDDGLTPPRFDLSSMTDVNFGCGGGGDTEVTFQFSYIWIANTGEGTVSKIDTVTGVELGRYRTAEGNDSPSRTSVNQYGDVAVANRSGNFGVTKIAAVEERCQERNGIDGIQTSDGPDNVLDFLEDECVLWHTEFPDEGNAIVAGSGGDGPRAVAWEGGELDETTCRNTVPNPRLWIGYGNTSREVYRLNGDTGEVEDHVSVGPAVVNGFTKIYGGAVNARGDLWFVTRGPGELTFVDGVTLDVQHYDIPDDANPYGMGVDETGDPWIVSWQGAAGPNHAYHFDVDTEAFILAGGIEEGRFRGMNIDREGRLWAAAHENCRLTVFDARTDTLIDDDIELPDCVTPVGISIDQEGFVWVVDMDADRAYKVHPETYEVALTVEGLNQPYTYSDMTGAGLNLVINPPG